MCAVEECEGCVFLCFCKEEEEEEEEREFVGSRFHGGCTKTNAPSVEVVV